MVGGRRRQRPAAVGQGELFLVLAAPHARGVELGDPFVLLRGESEHAGGDGPAFLFIGVEEPIVGSGQDLAEFPAQVVGVADPGVEALGAGGGVHMRGVTDQQDAAAAVVLGQPDVGPKHRLPLDISQREPPVAGMRLDSRVDLSQVLRRLFVGREPDHPLEGVTVRQRAGTHEATLDAGPDVPVLA
ncbi:Uncharacterised protein [Mycobacteroides abscessus subsp. abscessus]|nr:Uncharacterised protein [Mycobacteroides abscessus subsp. abscessus]